MGGKVSYGGHNKSNCLSAFWSHDPYPGSQWCVTKTFSSYFVTLSQWKISLLFTGTGKAEGDERASGGVHVLPRKGDQTP